MDVAAERISSQPVAGMAMLLVDKPQYDHANSWAKRAFDISFAAAALIVVAPVMAVTAIAVKVFSGGPVLYRAERCGINGRSFGMLKFRSMVVGADAQLADLITAAGGDAMYFKLKDDPRVTPVGRLMRKFSVDELPQFINVLKGDMSVVGPRPQAPHQVVTHDDLMRRRMLVRPGVTGLWQVSGRSDLTPEDATRLDLSYVENWSMAQDLVIIGRTVGVVVLGRGAY
jgi:exopolysaccharide biosynthesis polyprenyl glycosylphosphotransferase